MNNLHENQYYAQLRDDSTQSLADTSDFELYETIEYGANRAAGLISISESVHLKMLTAMQVCIDILWERHCKDKPLEERVS